MPLSPDRSPRGWTRSDLTGFLKHGMSPQGSMFNEMFPVMHLSTQHLGDEDLAAMSTYLLGEQPPQAKVIQAVAEDQLSDSAKRGRQHRNGHRNAPERTGCGPADLRIRAI